MIGGGVSNEAGDFVIPCGAKEARVRISCMGFKTIERVMAIGQVGTIQMQMENNYLHNVTVTGHPPIIRNKGDRLQYIVANDQFAKGQDMLELLSRVPTVSLSNGYASILGKGRAVIMLNGRVIENGNEDFRQKLWSLRAEDIERIEVISIPPSRYESNEGGYINIILKRDQTKGWRGDVTGLFALSDTWSGAANGSASYSSEKFDMTIGADLERKADIIDTESRYNFTGIYKTSYTHQKWVNEIFGGNGLFRYQPLENLELGAMVS
jgi:outer membrane receptor for ferrienterochelin and colicin